MAITNYSELQTAVQNWLDRDDLVSRVSEFIELAEVTLYNQLRVLEMESIDATLTTTARRIDLPSDFIEAKRFNLDTDPLRRLDYMTPEAILDEYTSTNGKPDFFTVIAKKLEFNKTPDDAYATTLVYYAKPAKLSVTATNDILSAYPNLFTYGALMQAEPFIGNDARLAVWAKMYDAGMTLANQQSNNARHSGSSMRCNTSGPVA